MKFCLLIIFIFVDNVTAQVHNQTEVENNAAFIMDIKKWSKSTYVTILYDADFNDTKETIFIFKLSKLLFAKRVQSLTLKLSNINHLKYGYRKRTNRPLIIVYFSTVKSVERFELRSKGFNMKWALWVFIFKERNGKLLLNYCTNPPGNPFHLSFNSKVLVKCYDNANLREWYSIYENKTEIRDFAKWNPKDGLFLKTQKRLYDRRPSIGGKTLRTVTVKQSTIPRFRNQLQLVNEVLKELGQIMNFSTILVSKEDQYGTWENGKWSGVMRKLYTGVADLAATKMEMSENRLRYVDFTIPLAETYKAFYFRKPNGTEIRGFGYFQAFHKNVWIFSLSLLIIIPMCLTFITYRVEKCLPFLFLENVFKIWRIYCQQGVTDCPKRSALRIVYFVTFMSSFVLLSAYSASLISHLTVSLPELPFSNADEFLKQDSYKVAVLRQSESHDTIKNARDWRTRKMLSLLKNEEDLPQTTVEGFLMVCNEKRTTFYTPQSLEGIITHFAPCPLTKIRTSSKTTLAMSLPKESPYTEVFNYHLQRFKEYGILERIARNNFRKRLNFRSRETGSIALYGIKSVLGIVLGGLVLALFILILEKIHFNYYEKKNRKKREIYYWEVNM